jgi:hypothetical protein
VTSPDGSEEPVPREHGPVVSHPRAAETAAGQAVSAAGARATRIAPEKPDQQLGRNDPRRLWEPAEDEHGTLASATGTPTAATRSSPAGSP